jgi:hypothetical protein
MIEAFLIGLGASLIGFVCGYVAGYRRGSWYVAKQVSSTLNLTNIIRRK